MSRFSIKEQVIPAGRTDVFYEVRFEVDGYPMPADLVWSCTNKLPKGLILNANNGVLSGTTSIPFLGTITIKAKSEAQRHSSSERFELYIEEYKEPPQIELSIMELDFSVLLSSEDYSIELRANGGTPPYKWSIENLPIGMKLDSEYIIGSPLILGGRFPLNVNVVDSADNKSNIFKWIEIKKN